jgi:urease accessory protein UreF
MRQPEAYRQPPGRESMTTEAELLPEHFSALLRQIGSPEDFPDLVFPRIPEGGIRDLQGLREFLEGYQKQMIVPVEMPAIARAHYHAARGHARELLALDQKIGGEPLPPPLASASRRIGRAQLERLRPLRDERTVQRYLAAVEGGQAHGWHTVVYGLTLAVYSWPLRHGLLTYARETLWGLGQAASRPAGLPEAVCRDTLHSLFLMIPAAIEQTLASCGEWGRIAKSEE